MTSHFEFNLWCAYWFLVGLSAGSTIMFLINRKRFKNLKNYTFKSLFEISKEASNLLGQIKVYQRVTKRLVEICDELLKRKG
jgi:hypothetical protein